MRTHFQGALKQSPLEPDDIFYRKQKLAGLSQKSLTFMLHVLFYPFLLKTCFKSVGEPLYPLTVHPKLIFRGAPRNALKVLEDQYYQRQYFVNIFPSTLALTLQIHFYSSLSGIILICALKVIALKSATFSAPETNLETLHFMLFLKNLTKNLEKKLVIKFVLME